MPKNIYWKDVTKDNTVYEFRYSFEVRDQIVKTVIWHGNDTPECWTYLRSLPKYKDMRRKVELYSEGKYNFPAPPVVTAMWNHNDWIVYIENNGEWLEDKEN